MGADADRLSLLLQKFVDASNPKAAKRIYQTRGSTRNTLYLHKALHSFPFDQNDPSINLKLAAIYFFRQKLEGGEFNKKGLTETYNMDLIEFKNFLPVMQEEIIQKASQIKTTEGQQTIYEAALKKNLERRLNL